MNPNEPSASPPKRSNATLAGAISDAHMLLDYASHHGIDLDNSIVTTLVESASLNADNAMTDDNEAAFWAALNSLSKAVAPVSAGSLRAIMDSNATTKTVFGMTVPHRSPAGKAVRRYTTLAFVSLILLLVVQIYWLFGTTITSDIQKTRDKYEEMQAKLRTMEKLNAQGAGKAKNPSGEQTQSGGQQDTDISALRAQILTLKVQKNSGYELLAFWSTAWEQWLPHAAEKGLSDSPPDKEIGANTARLQTARMVLEVLQRYFLPILYGFLGTCVYILRTLSSQIALRTYAEAGNIGFRIRLYLGMLGGMVFAWFVIPPESNDALFKSLSPFALAFLAGYSVELLFAAMDRFLAAFTTKAPG